METTIQRVESQDSFEFGKANSRMKIYADGPEAMKLKIITYRALGMIDINGEPIVPKPELIQNGETTKNN